jgi:hypothetical protein
VVHLRHTEQGTAFFGPLGARPRHPRRVRRPAADVVQRFVTAMAASLHDHVDGLERNDASVAEGQSGRH